MPAATASCKCGCSQLLNSGYSDYLQRITCEALQAIALLEELNIAAAVCSVVWRTHEYDPKKSASQC